MNQIVADLQTLVPNTLNSVIAPGLTKVNPFDLDFPGFPCAVVIPPILKTADYEDTATNLRQYQWWVMVVTTADNIPKSDPTYIAGLEDSVAAVFDTDSTLGGTAIAGLFPAVVEPPGPVVNGAVTYIAFYIQLTAQTIVPAAVQSA